MNDEILKKIYKSAGLLYIEDEAKNISNDLEDIILKATRIEKLEGIETYNTINFSDLRDNSEGDTFSVEEALYNTKQSKYSYFEIKEFVE